MENQVNLSQAQLDQLVASLHINVMASTHGTATGLAAVDFCKAWPVARSVLEILSKIPAAGLIVGIIITIGDAYSKKHCTG